MTIQLSQKERMLLEDQKSHEEICVQKYSNYAGQAQDPQLKELFNTYAGQEQQHLDTINQILAGQQPNMGGQQGQQQQAQQSTEQAQLPAGNYQKRLHPLPGYAHDRKICVRHLQHRRL